MEVKRILGGQRIDYKKQEKFDETKPQSSPVSQPVTAKSPVNPSFYGAYNNISFKGRGVDNTNFRADLEKRAAISTTTLKTYPDFKIKTEKHSYKSDWEDNGKNEELKLYKTKHHEYVQSADGTKIYKVKYVDNKDRITQQVMASKLYQSVGVRTPEYIPFEKGGKTGWLVEVIEEKLAPQETNKDAMVYSFVADVWLGNRNGLSKGNTMIDKDGKPVKMSVSGALGYRASGRPKDQKVGYEISEIKSMRDYSKNPDAASALSGVTDDEIYSAIEKLKSNYNSRETYKLCGWDNVSQSYRANDTFLLEPANVISNRMYGLENFIRNDKQEKLLKRRGLLEEGTPRLPNLRSFDRSFSIATEAAREITDEQWQKLIDRRLFEKHSWLKPLDMLDYKYIAQMTDEEHAAAMRRNLYAQRRGEDAYGKDIGGLDIQCLSKLSNSEWDIVVARDLLDAKIKHNVSGVFVSEFIEEAVKTSYDDWHSVVSTGYYDKHITAKDLKDYVDLRDEAKRTRILEPDFDERMRLLCGLEAKDTMYIDQEWRPSTLIAFAKASNDTWKRVDELTKGFTDKSLDPNTIANLCSFDDDAFETLKKRGFTEPGSRAYGLKEIALLTDEEYENVQKRGLKELYPEDYPSWAHLASLSDEEFKLAQDKNLFIDRSETNKDKRFSGKEIKNLVRSMTDEDWKNFEKRGFLKDYVVFNGWAYSAPYGDLAITLSKYSDEEFQKYNDVKNAAHSYIYPSTITELVKLPEEQYQRLFERDLFKYMNTHEAWDNYTEDAPVMIALAELDDKDYKSFTSQKNGCKYIATRVLIVNADKLGLNTKHSIAELDAKQKKQYLKLLIAKGGLILGSDFQDNYKGFAILPKNPTEYKEIVQKLVKSTGVYTKPLDETTKANFFNAIGKITEPNSEFLNLDLKPYGFKLGLKYDRQSFMDDIQSLVKDLDETEKTKVWDYFGFEIASTPKVSRTIFGYPTLANNGEKLKEIDNPKTKAVIEQIRPYVRKFTEENAIIPDGRFITPSMADTLNNIFKALPELYTTIGRKQHDTHDYTIDIHSLSVLQECIKNPDFKTLSKEEQQTMIFGALLHDITKEEKSIDKSHPENSSFDAYFLLEKFNLPKSQQLNIYQMIKNHDMLEKCNKGPVDPKTGRPKPITEEEQDRKVQRYAYEFRSENLAKMANIFTKADLKSVDRNGYFYNRFEGAYDKVSAKLEKEVKKVQSTAILLPQTKIPAASQLKTDDVNVVTKVTYDEDGSPITNKVVNLSKDLDLSKYGFAEGVNGRNFNVLVHAFDRELSNVMLDVMDFAKESALLSASYVVYEKGNYHTFRPYGVIKDVLSDNIGTAYYRDFGSGCKKTEELLVAEYLNGNCFKYRSYISSLIKKELNLSDEEYIKFYNETKDKPLDEIERENPKAAEVLKKIFSEMEIHKRKYNRNYNEVLFGGQGESGKTTAVFYQGKVDGKPLKLEDLPAYLRKYAQDNDLPIIYFGE